VTGQPSGGDPGGPRGTDYVAFFADLERQLSGHSHTSEPVEIIEQAVQRNFKKTAARQIAFSYPGAILVPPILYDEALSAGAIGADEDRFHVLQGDIISTESAYFLGERITGSPLFAVLNSSCDLIPRRRDNASLLRISPILGGAEDTKKTLQILLSFKSRRDLYLPPIPDENPAALGYAAHFDGIAQIRLKDLFLARRVQSLSLVGWRIFGSFSRVLIARSTDGEVRLRSLSKGGA
jgi:hypothetical protein